MTCEHSINTLFVQAFAPQDKAFGEEHLGKGQCSMTKFVKRTLKQLCNLLTNTCEHSSNALFMPYIVCLIGYAHQ